MIDPNILIFSVVASLCFGFLIGFILRGIFRKKNMPEAKVELDKALAAETAKKKARDPHFHEVAQLWRDNRDHRLVFQIDNKYFKRGDDLSTRDKDLLLKVVEDFYHWLETDSPIRRVEVNASQPNQSQPSEPFSALAKNVASKDQESSLKIDMSPANVLAQAMNIDVRQPASSSQSMVTQVDAILQEKLHRAGMKKWAIRLTEFPQRGMVVMVGLEQYNSIDEVPYERVRSIIRESVSEWEQRVENGSIVQ